jgi:predicted glycosyltransferase
MKRFWVDVDNPPQAQYLSPIARDLRDRGHSVLLTARDHQATLDVLANRGEVAIPVGGPFGSSRASKALGSLGRAARLRTLVSGRIGRPAAVVSTSRSGVLAARLLSSPAFTVLDYEGVELGVFRRSGTIILHPAVIPAERFIERGFSAGRLHAFDGLKEDLAFAGLDVESASPAMLPAPRNPALPAVLVRPPSETSHYRVDESVRMIGLVLDRLAELDDVQVVFSPREPAQRRMVDKRTWRVPPVVLERPLPLVELLRAVDRVVTGGGTMLREAAWLGVPGVSVFQGQTPAVDGWLESQGLVTHVGDARSLGGIEWARPTSERGGLERRPDALRQVTDFVLQSAMSVGGETRPGEGVRRA